MRKRGQAYAAEKIALIGIKRDERSIYYIKDGDVWQSREGKRDQRIARTAVEMDYSRFVYFLDGDGDLARAPRRRASASRAPVSILAFSWGYYGWGNYTKELVEAVDAVEAERGYEPPIFVDIRIRRSVRASGFREKAFERLLGARYQWIRGLGNRLILDPTLEKVTIAEPSAASILLDTVVDAHSDGRRVIFFCGCRYRPDCHRTEVTDLLLKVAKRKRVRLTVQEWPGGVPVTADIEVSREEMRALQHAAKAQTDEEINLALGTKMPLRVAASLPFGSLLRCRSAREEVVAVANPAIHSARGWTIPLVSVLEPRKVTAQTKRDVAASLDDFDLGPHGGKLPRTPLWSTRSW